MTASSSGLPPPVPPIPSGPPSVPSSPAAKPTRPLPSVPRKTADQGKQLQPQSGLPARNQPTTSHRVTPLYSAELKPTSPAARVQQASAAVSGASSAKPKPPPPPLPSSPPKDISAVRQASPAASSSRVTSTEWTQELAKDKTTKHIKIITYKDQDMKPLFTLKISLGMLSQSSEAKPVDMDELKKQIDKVHQQIASAGEGWFREAKGGLTWEQTRSKRTGEHSWTTKLEHPEKHQTDTSRFTIGKKIFTYLHDAALSEAFIGASSNVAISLEFMSPPQLPPRRGR